MAFKTKSDLEKLLQEFDYVPTATAKERQRWQLLKMWGGGGRLIGIGGPVTVKQDKPKQNIAVAEASALEYAYLYENNVDPKTGINPSYGHLIQKAPKAKSGKQDQEDKGGK